MALFILAVIVFIIADFLLRLGLKRFKEKKLREEREAALRVSLRLDFSREAKTLKRVDVDKPKARIICVDDEDVVLDSFRRILVLDGYSIDTVKTGQEALGLVQSHQYDFAFVDLKMPEMAGEDVVKSIKHLRPDMDVVVITGYATIESAVECMQFGAMDYIQKPFTENELVEMTKKFLIRRTDRIQKELRPRVLVTRLPIPEHLPLRDFSIPGGVFISNGHCWARMEEDGKVKVGLDDFAKKVIGRIDCIEPPNLGRVIMKDQVLFSVKQGYRTIPFRSPITGRVAAVNSALTGNPESLETTPYDRNWICMIDADNLDTELRDLKIGRSAVSFYQDELDHLRLYLKPVAGDGQNGADHLSNGSQFMGTMENLNDVRWEVAAQEFFAK
ncbi:MAG: response regulator [Ignavibacteria bacterium]|nr:response regulator [Ignavibacteria bacterium]